LHIQRFNSAAGLQHNAVRENGLYLPVTNFIAHTKRECLLVGRRSQVGYLLGLTNNNS